jgi:hypothetical protein
MTTPLTQHDLSQLRQRALDVTSAPAVRRGEMSAREAAAALTGVISWIVRSSSIDTMQAAVAELVRFEPAWRTSFGCLPSVNGAVDSNVSMIAIVARGLLELAGPTNLRAALAFWACERDVAIWMNL